MATASCHGGARNTCRSGGPAGGDGGRGGDVVLVVDEGLRTLVDFRYQRHFKAESGQPGGTANRHGADGEDLLVKVPPGTIVRDRDTGEFLAISSSRVIDSWLPGEAVEAEAMPTSRTLFGRRPRSRRRESLEKSGGSSSSSACWQMSASSATHRSANRRCSGR